jgi:transcriptional regulator with XRE-family HTH domain
MSEIVNLLKPTDSTDSTTEFYTVEATGDSGMSQSGLAALCGVSQQAISKLERTLTTNSPSKTLEPFVGKSLTLTTSDDANVVVNGKPVGRIKIYKASFCAAVIRHYDRLGNEVAQYSTDQFTEIGINVWIQSVTGWSRSKPSRTYVPYWYQRLTLFTAKTRIPDGWWSIFEELAKMMRELEGYGYVLPDVSVSTGRKITPDISVGKMFCKYMKDQGFNVDGETRKYTHYYPDGREELANIYPDKWLEQFRTWFNLNWKQDRLLKYLGERDPEALPSINRLLGLLPEGE